MNFVVVIASAGRPESCAEAIDAIQQCILPGSSTLVGYLSVPSILDAPASVPDNWTVLVGSRGASVQRNAALSLISESTDIVCYLDDDSVPRTDYLVRIAQAFTRNPDVVGLNSRPILDGAVEHRELTLHETFQALTHSFDNTPASSRVFPCRTSEMYACGASVRWAIARDIRFDERLPLYSWLEDRDYAIRLTAVSPGHYFANAVDAVFVHRAVGSGGRSNHRRLGYSQVSNPIWLHEKGSFSLRLMIRFVIRSFAGNLVFGLFPVRGRSGRLRRLQGNLQALGDVVRSGGRATPERAVEISSSSRTRT